MGIIFSSSSIVVVVVNMIIFSVVSVVAKPMCVYVKMIKIILASP